MQVNKKKKKKIIVLVSIVLIILSFPLIMHGLYSRGISFALMPVVIINGPNSVYTGESGTVDYTITLINKFMKAEGTAEFRSSDPEILEITKDGKWEAKKPGTVRVLYDIEYSKKTLNKLRLLNAMNYPVFPIFEITVSDRQ